MVLLQGGTQTEARVVDDYIVLTSEAGVSIYLLSTKAALAFCSLANTISADITDSGLYICTASVIHFIPKADLAGDSTAHLTTLSITPIGSISKLCAELNFLAYISSTRVGVVALPTLSQRTLAVSGLLHLDTYNIYLAFATSTKVYTFSIKAPTLQLSSCFTPEADGTSKTFTKSSERRCKPQTCSAHSDAMALYHTTWNGHYHIQHALLKFGDFLSKQGSNTKVLNNNYTSGCVGGHGVDTVAFDGMGKDFYLPNAIPVTTYEYNIGNLINSWKAGYDLVTLNVDYGFKYTSFTSQDGAAVVPVGDNRSYGSSNNTCFYVVVDGVKKYIPLSWESYGSFRYADIIGWVDNGPIIFGWFSYKYHQALDPEGYYYGSKVCYFTFNKYDFTYTIELDTYRADALAVARQDYAYFSPYYFSQAYKWGDYLVVADRIWDHADHATTNRMKQVKIFLMSNSTLELTLIDTFTLYGQELVSINSDFSMRIAKNSFMIGYEKDEADTRKTDFLYTRPMGAQKTYDITAIALGTDLAIADSGTGIHCLGVTGHMPKLIPETEAVTALDILPAVKGVSTVAYSTATKSKVVAI